MSLVRQQDLPPPGGYKPIPYIRMPAKQVFKPLQLFGLYGAVTLAGWYLWGINFREVRREQIESRSAKMAMIPLLAAEYDREVLKQVRHNRDDEAKLMANVEGWKVGTWYGEPVYKTTPKDELRPQTFMDMYAHATWEEMVEVNDFNVFI